MSERAFTDGTFRCNRCLDTGNVYVDYAGIVPCGCGQGSPAPPLPQSAEPKPLEEILAGKDGKGATGWELLAAADEMARRLRAVAALHVRAKHTDAEGMTYCDACAEDMPCPTAKALAGERQ